MINVRRKLTSVVSALAVMYFVLGGDNPAAAADDGSGTVTLWVGSWWGTQVPILQKLWQADHPQIKLDVEPLPINGYLDKFATSALGGAPPDIIDLDTTWLSTAAAQGLLQPGGSIRHRHSSGFK
jgi:multiple sugar transport system substrate-binding protein